MHCSSTLLLAFQHLDSVSRERLESCMLQYHKATACAREALRWKPPHSVDIFLAKRRKRLLLHLEQAERGQQSQELQFTAKELKSGEQGITEKLKGENEEKTIEEIDSDIQLEYMKYTAETQGDKEKRLSISRLTPNGEVEGAKEKSFAANGIYVIFSSRKIREHRPRLPLSTGFNHAVEVAIIKGVQIIEHVPGRTDGGEPLDTSIMDHLPCLDVNRGSCFAGETTSGGYKIRTLTRETILESRNSKLKRLVPHRTQPAARGADAKKKYDGGIEMSGAPNNEKSRRISYSTTTTSIRKSDCNGGSSNDARVDVQVHCRENRLLSQGRPSPACSKALNHILQAEEVRLSGSCSADVFGEAAANAQHSNSENQRRPLSVPMSLTKKRRAATTERVAFSTSSFSLALPHLPPSSTPNSSFPAISRRLLSSTSSVVSSPQHRISLTEQNPNDVTDVRGATRSDAKLPARTDARKEAALMSRNHGKVNLGRKIVNVLLWDEEPEPNAQVELGSFIRIRVSHKTQGQGAKGTNPNNHKTVTTILAAMEEKCMSSKAAWLGGEKLESTIENPLLGIKVCEEAARFLSRTRESSFAVEKQSRRTESKTLKEVST